MTEFLDFFKTQQVDTAMVIFLMVFSCGIAVFHTLIFLTLYQVKLRPKWFFFAFNPALVAIGYWILSGYALLALIVLFGSVFLFAIIGMIYAGIKGDDEDKAFLRQYPKPKKPLWKKILGVVFAILLFLTFFVSGVYFFVIIFAIAIGSAFMPSSKNRFLKYQATLPTSKIRSMAMGLIEVQGKLVAQNLLAAPIEKTLCIGYKYVIESISRDKDGDESYSEVFSETKCNTFLIEDETGNVEVNPEKIEFVWVGLDNRYSTGSRRYSQYVIKPNDEMLIIGKASLQNNTPVIEHENIKDVFAIAPKNAVIKYNTYKPLLNSFLVFSCVLAFFTAIVLVSSVHISGGNVVVNLQMPGLDLFNK